MNSGAVRSGCILTTDSTILVPDRLHVSKHPGRLERNFNTLYAMAHLHYISLSYPLQLLLD